MLATTHKINRKNTEQRVYDSVSELIDHAMATDEQSKRNRRQLGHGKGLEFFLDHLNFVGRTFKSVDAIQLAAGDRWGEGLELIESMLDEVRDATLPAPKCRRRRTRFSDIDGAELDYDRLRSGQDFWRTTYREQSTGPANLTLAVDVAANARITPREIIWRGIVAIVLTEVLESAGYRVELWAYEAATKCYTDGTDDLIAARLKSLAEPLDRSTLVNAVSGWFFRTIVFAELSQSHDGRTLCDGYGRHRLPESDELCDVTHDPETLVVQDIWNRRDAITFIRTTLERFSK